MVSDKLKSKSGISLPLAMAITSVLIILSASLIAIASTSIMSTSSSMNNRQAYLNVRSALNYAWNYYGDSSKVADFKTVSDEYLVMKDTVGGTTAQGVEITKEAARAAAAVTYVHAYYDEPEEGSSQQPMFVLEAFSKSTDAFGNRGETAHLKACYSVGGGSRRNLVTIADLDMDAEVVQYPREAITLNVKGYPGMDWVPFYYLWTYKDTQGIYTGKSTCYDVEAAYKYGNRELAEGLDWSTLSDAQKQEKLNENTAKATEMMNKLNSVEWKNNSVAPVGIWNVMPGNATSEENGPPSFFGKSNLGWRASTYYYDPETVNYFNLIVTKKGQILAPKIGGHPTMKTVDDVQSNEMMHLWYLSESDKNVYFEFLTPPVDSDGTQATLRYRMQSDWNGYEELDNRYIVYLSNQKTTVHFKVKGIGDDGINSLTAETDPPYISGVLVGRSDIKDPSNAYLTAGIKFARYNSTADSNVERTGSSTPFYYPTDTNPSTPDEFNNLIYEGMGWWVANIPVAVPFTLNISYYDKNNNIINNTVAVTPNSTKEAWVVADPSRKTMVSRLTERKASDAIGSDYKAYSTVHLKSSESGTVIAPRLSYSVGNSSSLARRKLLEAIESFSDYGPEDYEDESFNALQQKVQEGIELYNNTSYISDQLAAGKTMEEIDAVYDAKRAEIEAAIGNLRAKVADADTITKLEDLINEAEAIIEEQEKKCTYDYGKYRSFIADTGAYKQAVEFKAHIEENNSSASEVYEQINALSAAIDTIKNAKLQRKALKDMIEEAEPYAADTNTRYSAEYRGYLKDAIDAARPLLTSNATQEEVDDAKDNVYNWLEELKRHSGTEQDISALERIIELAKIKYRNKKDYTNEMRTNLNNAITAASVVYNNGMSDQDAIDEATSTLVAAYNACYVAKPTEEAFAASKTEDYIEKDNKVRVWFRGLNPGDTIERYYDKDAGEYKDYFFGVVSLSIQLYRRQTNTGENISGSSLTKVSGQGLSYYDFDSGDVTGVVIMANIRSGEATYNESTGKWDFVNKRVTPYTSDLINFQSGANTCMIDLNRIEQKVTGQSATDGSDIIEYTLDADCYKLTELYVDGPTGTKVEVTDKDNNIENYTASSEGEYQYNIAGFDITTQDGAQVRSIRESSENKHYQVVRFPYQKNQTARIQYADPETGRTFYSKSFGTTAGQSVVRLDKSSPQPDEGYVTLMIEAPAADEYFNHTYNETLTATIDGEDTECTASGVAQFNRFNNMVYTVTYTDGDKDYPAAFDGTYYYARVPYEEGMSFKVKYDFGYEFSTVSYELDGEMETTTIDPQYRTVTISDISYQINMNTALQDGKMAAFKFTSKDILGNGTTTPESSVYNAETFSIWDIYPYATDDTSGSARSTSSGTSLDGIVSQTFADSLLTVPTITSAEKEYTTSFDYFGQAGSATVPTKNFGKTVIWIDGNIKDNANDGKALKDVVGGFTVYAWDENGTALNGSGHGNQAINVENSNYYYAVVSSSARGCVIYRNDNNKKIGWNKNDSRNFYFDTTHTTYVNSDVSGNPTTKPCGCIISGQGFCCPYEIIDQNIYDGKSYIKQADGTYRVGWFTTVDQYAASAPGHCKFGSYNFTYYASENKDWATPYYETTVSRQRCYYAMYKYRARHQDEPPVYTYKMEEIDESSMTGKDLRMPFVGGDKLRIQNESYYATYGAQYFQQNAGIKKPWASSIAKQNSNHNVNIGVQNLFGGKNGNNNSDGRVGDSRLNILYDWYEYKIPVDSSNTYTLQFSGLKYNINYVKKMGTSVSKLWSSDDFRIDEQYSTQIQDVYGDVWVVMDDTIADKNTHRFENVTINTVDPEVFSIETNQKIYFRVPDDTWSAPTCVAKGVGGSENITFTLDNNADPVNHRIYSASVPAKKPFLLFSASHTVNGANVNFVASTSLQGNDVVLFDPSYNVGTGGWEEFISEEEKTIRAFYGAQTVYYGYVVPVQIDSNFKVVNSPRGGATYQFPKALKTHVIEGNFTDGNVKPYAQLSKSSEEVNRWVNAYAELYQLMAKAKAYIKPGTVTVYEDGTAKTVTYPYYQEYKNSNARDIFSNDTIYQMYKALTTAQQFYLAESSSDTYYVEIEKQTKLLEDAIRNLAIDDEGMCTVIFYDAQKKIATNHRISVQYTYYDGSTTGTTEVVALGDKDRNSEGCPVAYIKHSELYDVKFIVTDSRNQQSEGLVKDYIADYEGPWVYMDVLSNAQRNIQPYWIRNSVADYRRINVKEISPGSSKQVFDMKLNPDSIKQLIEDGKVYDPNPVRSELINNRDYNNLSAAEKSAWDQRFAEYKNKLNNSSAPIYRTRNSKNMFVYYVRSFDAIKDIPYTVITLYFKYNTVVTYENAAGDPEQYTIRAGAYTVDKNSRLTNSTVLDKNSSEIGIPTLQAGGANNYVDENYTPAGSTWSSYELCPYVYTYAGKAYVNRANIDNWVIRCDLCTERAKTFFTKPENYRKISLEDGTVVNAESDSSLSTWVDVDADALKIRRGGHNTSKSVNLTFNSGEFSSKYIWDYVTTGDLYLRWDNNDELKVNNTVKLKANSIRFASAGKIVSPNKDKHFYLIAPNNADSMIVEFPTDLNITYYDIYDDKHSFTIREGQYKVFKEKKTQNFVCDLFDDDYWTSMANVEIINRYGATGSEGMGGSGNTSNRLTNPSFS